MAEEPQELPELQEQPEPSTAPTVLKTKNLRQITFIPEAELELQRRRDDEQFREAGVARAYKQPAGTERIIPGPVEDEDEGSKNKKKEGTLVMVMKSAKLKDPEWLPSQAGTWVEHFEAAGITIDAGCPDTSTRDQSRHNVPPHDPKLSSPRLATSQSYHPIQGIQQQWPAPLASLQSAYGAGASSSHSLPPTPETTADGATTSSDLPIDPQLVSQSSAPIQHTPEVPIRYAPQFPAGQLYTDPPTLQNVSGLQTYAAQLFTPTSSYKSPFAPITEPGNLDDGPTLEGFENFAESQKRKATDEVGSPAKKPRIEEPPPFEVLELDQLTEPAPWWIVTPHPPPNSVAVRTHHLERLELEKEKDAAFQDSLGSIAAVVIPDILVRLDCVYLTTIGALLIKNNRSNIEYVMTSKDPSRPIVSLLSIPMKRVVKPSIAIEGSRPMEFRILCKDEDDAEITYRFEFGLSSSARKVANIFRAKIEDLKWALEMKQLNESGAKIGKGHTMARVTEAAQIDIVKPFRCESCGKRFKNRDGIIYHQKRSQTGCNPNWTGPIREPKPTRVKKPKIEKKAKAPKKSKSKSSKKQSSAKKAGMAITPDSEARGDQDSTGDEVDSDDSDDSVVRWFEQVNKAKAVGQGGFALSPSRSMSRDTSFPITPDTDRSHLNPGHTSSFARAQSQESDIQPLRRRGRKPSKLAAASKPVTEEGVLREILPELVQVQEPASESLQTDATPSVEHVPDIKEIEIKGCQDIVLKLVEGNSGIFPGDKSLWYAFVPEFIKLYSKASVTPSSKLCEDAVNALVAEDKLKLHTWEFQDRESNPATRSIITIAAFDISLSMADDQPETSVFATLKLIIEMEYPRYYVPSSCNIDERLLARLRDIFEPAVPLWKTGTKQMRFDSPEPPTKRRRTGRFSRLSSEVAELDRDNIYEELGVKSNKRKRSLLSAKERAAQVELQTHMWQQPAPLLQSENGAWRLSPLRVTPIPLPKKRRARTAMTEVDPRTWQQPPHNLQNPATSAWDVKPSQIKAPSRIYRLRHQLPEPITYMQDENGAWSIRPFGHGVKPIHQRPARRVYGNPHYDQYYKQIETGFRPILPPKRPTIGPVRLSVHISSATGNTASKKRGRRLVQKRDGAEEEERPAKRRNTRKTPETSVHDRDEDIYMSDSDYSEDSHFVMKPVGDTFKPTRRAPNASRKTPRKLKQRNGTLDTDLEDSLAFVSREDTPFESNHQPNRAPAENPEDDVLASIEDGTGSGLRLQPRYLTSLENRFSNFSKNSGAVLRELNLPFVPVGAVAKANRIPAMTEREEARFITAVVVIRSLTGGLDMSIDWILVGTLFRKYAITYLQKLWLTFGTSNRAKRKMAIDKYQDDFQALYVTAYANGSVPPIDYDNLLGYEWNEVIKWTMQKLGIEQIANQDTLERRNPEHEHRKAYFKKPGAMKGRLDIAASVASVAPPNGKRPVLASDVEIDDAAVAKSWARATVLTPTEQYNPEDAEVKLEPFADIIEGVTESLHRNKVLALNKGKQAQPGFRRYKPHSFFLKALYKKNVNDEQKFLDQVKYKMFLDQEFRSGKECVRVERQATESICLISLQAQGRVRLQPVDLNLLVMGMPKPALENGLRQHSRKKNLEKYKFQIDVYPTDSYVYSDDISVVDIAATAEPPRGGVKGELPLWYDIHENLISDLWKKALVSVVCIVHVRAGSSAKTLHGHFAPILEEWELQRLLEWGQSVGLFKKVMEGIDGWTVDDWWWMIVGSICGA